MSTIYGRPTDNVAPNATLTATTADTEYPAANAVDLDPGKPFKLNATTGNLVFDFGSAQRMDLVAIIHHNLTAALSNVKFQCNATNSWGAPTVDATLTVPSDWEDGYPVSFYKDLTTVSGYSSGGFRFARLNFGTANAAAVALGEIVILSQIRTLTKLEAEFQDREFRSAIVHETDYGIHTKYDRGTPRRTIGGTLFNVNTISTFDSLWRDARGVIKPFFFALDSTVNDARFVCFHDQLKVHRYQKTPTSVPTTFAYIELEELGKGLYL